MPQGFQVYTLKAQFDILFINVFPYIIIIEVDLNSMPQSHGWHFLLYEELTAVNVLQLLRASSHLLQQQLNELFRTLQLYREDKSCHIEVRNQVIHYLSPRMEIFHLLNKKKKKTLQYEILFHVIHWESENRTVYRLIMLFNLRIYVQKNPSYYKGEISAVICILNTRIKKQRRRLSLKKGCLEGQPETGGNWKRALDTQHTNTHTQQQGSGLGCCSG